MLSLGRFIKQFPVSESCGIFIGITGIEWLADGQARPFGALLMALLGGLAVSVYRYAKAEEAQKSSKHSIDSRF